MGRAPCASQSPARLYVLQGGSTAGPSHYPTFAHASPIDARRDWEKRTGSTGAGRVLHLAPSFDLPCARATTSAAAVRAGKRMSDYLKVRCPPTTRSRPFPREDSGKSRFKGDYAKSS